jgi:hypothetical protein
VFSWSYRDLSESAVRMFRLLGLHPGRVSPPAAASLAGIESGPAGRYVAELTAAHLLAEQVPGRYSCHDLLCAYVGEQAGACDSGPARRAALGRMLDHYLYTAHAAAGLLCPRWVLPALAAPPDGTRPEPPAASAEALSWFAAERPVLSAAVRLAADAGLDAPAWQLGWLP